MPLDAIALDHWISATQLDTYRLCPRKWAWEKLNGVKRPRNKYAQRGDDIHALLEGWLERGEVIDTSTEYGKIVAPGLKYLPPPRTGLVENKFTFRTETAIYVGKWDLFVSEHEGTFLKVLDHKTTGDFKWAMSAQDLKYNVQANLYTIAAIALSKEMRDRLLVQLNWIYYRTNANSPGARRVALFVLPNGMPLRSVVDVFGVSSEYVQQELTSGKTLEVMYQHELEERFGEIEATAKKMLDHRRAGHKAIDLEYKVEGCHAYGGCPFQGTHCKLTPQEKIRGYMEHESTAEKMRKAKKLQQGSTAATTETPEEKSSSGASVNMAEKMRKAASGEEASTTDTPSTASEVQDASPAINPPGEADAKPSPEPGEGGMPQRPMNDMSDRQALAGLVSIGIAGARLYQHSDPNYAKNVGQLSLEVADEILQSS